MSTDRDAMIKSLKNTVVPVLRERGFKGSIPHFYRKLEDKERVDLLMFQFSQWGGRLYIEVSKCPLDGSTGYEDEKISLNKIKVYQVLGKSRHRIKGDFGFDENNTDEVAEKIKNLLDDAEDLWENEPNWWND